MNFLFKGMLFCLIVLSGSVKADSVTVTWKGVISHFYLPSSYSNVKEMDIESIAQQLNEADKASFLINKDYSLHLHGSNVTESNAHRLSSVAIIHYRL